MICADPHDGEAVSDISNNNAVQGRADKLQSNVSLLAGTTDGEFPALRATVKFHVANSLSQFSVIYTSQYNIRTTNQGIDQVPLHIP